MEKKLKEVVLGAAQNNGPTEASWWLRAAADEADANDDFNVVMISSRGATDSGVFQFAGDKEMLFSALAIMTAVTVDVDRERALRVVKTVADGGVRRMAATPPGKQ